LDEFSNVRPTQPTSNNNNHLPILTGGSANTAATLAGRV